MMCIYIYIGLMSIILWACTQQKWVTNNVKQNVDNFLTFIF